MIGWIQETVSAGLLQDAFVMVTRVTVLLGAAWLFTALLKKTSASFRHLVWLVAVCGGLLLPVLPGLLPAWEVVPEVVSARSAATPAAAAAFATDGADEAVVARSAAAASPDVLATPAPTGTPPVRRMRWPAAVAALWLAGFLVGIVRIGAAIRRAGGLVDGTRPLESAPASDALEWCRGFLGYHKPVDLRVSDRVAIPFVWGWRRPAIVLPAGADRWSGDRMRAVLLHELAHVRRHDSAGIVLAGVAAAVYWFHPLAWLANRKIKQEMERAADDYVLNTGTDSSDYARHLLDISRGIVTPRQTAAGVALARRSELGGRVMDILAPRRNRTPLDGARRALVIVAAVLLTLPLASLTSHSSLATDDIDPAERAAMIATLSGFFDALNAGEDYPVVAYKYLSSDYFEPADMTVETMAESAWETVFDNTIRIMTEEGLVGPLTATARVKSIRRDNDGYTMTLETDLLTRRLPVESVIEEGDRIAIEVARDENGEPLPAEDAWLLRAHPQTVRFRMEDGSWKIDRYGDGLTIRRMDINNPYGPIYLVWVADMGPEITPHGSMISKVIPAQYRPFNNMGTTFVLED
jgi:beta-lactamase regulating signal transducer with metallopeptidase domain